MGPANGKHWRENLSHWGKILRQVLLDLIARFLVILVAKAVINLMVMQCSNKTTLQCECDGMVLVAIMTRPVDN
jgi:hypothetical protein